MAKEEHVERRCYKVSKIIYITEEQLKELKEQVTFFQFKNKLISFLKELLRDPINANLDPFFKNNGISRNTLMKILLKKNIIERKEKFDEVDGKSVYHLQYKIPKANFKTKVKRVYSYFFERSVDKSGIDDMVKNGMTQQAVNETDCAGVGAIGDGSDSSGQFVQPFLPMQKRDIYKPKTKNKKKD